MNDFAPTASWKRLRQRAALLHQLRTFFNERGFLEVETPLLSADTVVDRHLDPMQLLLPTSSDADSAMPMWLQTSPEFGMKRMLALVSDTSFDPSLIEGSSLMRILVRDSNPLLHV